MENTVKEKEVKDTVRDMLDQVYDGYCNVQDAIKGLDILRDLIEDYDNINLDKAYLYFTSREKSANDIIGKKSFEWFFMKNKILYFINATMVYLEMVSETLDELDYYDCKIEEILSMKKDEK